MAITILKPRQGLVTIEPTTSYESVVAKYAEDFRQAIILEEDSKIANWARALDRGDLTYKDFRKKLLEIMGGYDENSQRRVDIQQTLDQAQIADLRRRDLLLQNKLTEKFLKGGLSSSELVSIHGDRLDFLRGENAPVIDPELWSSAMNDYANAYDNLLTESSRTSSSARAEKLARLETELLEVNRRYHDPTHPDPISGAEWDKRVDEIYQQVNEIGGSLSATDVQNWNAAVQRRRIRDADQLALVDYREVDPTTGLDVVIPVTTDYAKGHKAVREVQTASGETHYEIYDTSTGNKVSGTGTFKDKPLAEAALNEIVNSSTFEYRDPVTGELHQARYQLPDDKFISTTPIGGEAVDIYGDYPGTGKPSQTSITTPDGRVIEFPEYIGARVTGAPAEGSRLSDVNKTGSPLTVGSRNGAVTSPLEKVGGQPPISSGLKSALKGFEIPGQTPTPGVIPEITQPGTKGKEATYPTGVTTQDLMAGRLISQDVQNRINAANQEFLRSLGNTNLGFNNQFQNFSPPVGEGGVAKGYETTDQSTRRYGQYPTSGNIFQRAVGGLRAGAERLFAGTLFR